MPTSTAPETDKPGPPRPSLQASRRGRLADPVFRWICVLAGLSVLGVLAWMIGSTTADSAPVFRSEGLRFFYGSEWDPGNNRQGLIEGTYQVGEFLWGTVVTALLAMALAVPLAIAVALYLTQLAPRRIAKPLTYAVDLLAAVPSVIYGLWGSLFLVPLLVPVLTAVANTVGTVVPFLAGPVQVRNLFVASLVLGIMVLPITSAVIREVFATVPESERFAAYGLGATRWEVMREVVLPRSRAGIIGGSMLGLGRALGETIAVLLIIGGNERFGFQLFQANNTIAAEIAAAFREASPEHINGLIAMGVALFLVTILVNVAARAIVNRLGQVAGDAAL